MFLSHLYKSRQQIYNFFLYDIINLKLSITLVSLEIECSLLGQYEITNISFVKYTSLHKDEAEHISRGAMNNFRCPVRLGY